MPDEKQYTITESDRRILLAIWTWIKGFRIFGPGVDMRNSMGTCAVSVSWPPSSPPTIRSKTITGKVTAPIEPGAYLATIFAGTPTGSYDDGEFAMPTSGMSAGTLTGIVLNMPEAGMGTNWVGNGTSLVVWPTGGTGTADGTTYPIYWANAALLPIFPVTLTQTGGSAGSNSAYTSFTYTAKDPAGNTLGTGLSPNWSPTRIVMIASTAATQGDGYYSSGAFVLNGAYEIAASQDNCP